MCSKRKEARLVHLSSPEVADLYLLAYKVGAMLQAEFDANALTLNVQDGADAGQSVPHVHVHVLPRKPGDFAKNDDIYDAIDAGERDEQAARSSGQVRVDADDRTDRTPEQMADEASRLRKRMAEFLN